VPLHLQNEIRSRLFGQSFPFDRTINWANGSDFNIIQRNITKHSFNSNRAPWSLFQRPSLHMRWIHNSITEMYLSKSKSE
jgi:hypothetical protein